MHHTIMNKCMVGRGTVLKALEQNTSSLGGYIRKVDGLDISCEVLRAMLAGGGGDS